MPCRCSRGEGGIGSTGGSDDDGTEMGPLSFLGEYSRCVVCCQASMRADKAVLCPHAREGDCEVEKQTHDRGSMGNHLCNGSALVPLALRQQYLNVVLPG